MERAGAEAFASAVARMLAEAAPILDERQRRVLMGAGARRLGRGGIKLIAAATGASADTVGRGAAEVEAGLVADGRVRAKGAGQGCGPPGGAGQGSRSVAGPGEAGGSGDAGRSDVAVAVDDEVDGEAG